ncbi:MAG: hypothetical protein WCL14_12910 [Bacteroidota bacterium]
MKNIAIYLITLWWYVREQEVVTKTVADLRNIFLENNFRNREFVRRWQGTERYKDVNFVLVKLFNGGFNRNGKKIFMMSMPSTGQVVTARLALTDVHATIVERARYIKSHITGNTNVVFTAPEILALGTAINTYEDSHGAAREVAYKALNTLLKSYLVRIQAASDANPTQSIVIIQSCGCVVQGVGGQHEQIFDCFNGVAGGSVVLVAPAGPNHSCHEWWYSKNNVDWARIEPTMNANTLMSGLEVGKTAYFRHQIIIPTGGTGMSQIISITVT